MDLVSVDWKNFIFFEWTLTRFYNEYCCCSWMWQYYWLCRSHLL